LVVIGILIALQINNWNEDRKHYDNEIEIYRNAITDLEAEANDITNNLQWYKAEQDVVYHLYNVTKGKVDLSDSAYFNDLYWVYTYNPIIHDNYKDKLSTLSNTKTRDLFSKYIGSENKTKDAFEEFNTMKLNVLRPYFSIYGI